MDDPVVLTDLVQEIVLEPSRIKILLLPIGQCQLQRRIDVIRKYQNIALSQLPSLPHHATSKLNLGRSEKITLDFLTVCERTTLEVIATHHRVFGLLVIAAEQQHANHDYDKARRELSEVPVHKLMVLETDARDRWEQLANDCIQELVQDILEVLAGLRTPQVFLRGEVTMEPPAQVQRRAKARAMKLQADTYLLAGNALYARDYYQSAFKFLEDENDVLWLGSALDGMSTAVVMVGERQSSIEGDEEDYETPQPVTQLEDAMRRVQEAIQLYGKAQVPELEVPSALKLAALASALPPTAQFIASTRRQNVVVLLHRVWALQATLPEIKTQVKTLMRIAAMFKDMGYRRKTGLVLLSVIRRLESVFATPSQPEQTLELIGDQDGLYRLVMETCGHFDVLLSRETSGPGWENIQVDVLDICMSLMKSVGHERGLREVSKAKQSFTCAVSRDEQMALLPFNKGDHGSGSLLVSLQPLSSDHLPAIVVKEIKAGQVKQGIAQGPFIYSPFDRAGSATPKRSTKAAAQEELALELELKNPFPYPLDLEAVACMTAGVKFRTWPTSIRIPGSQGHARITLVGVPECEGTLKLTGVAMKMLGQDLVQEIPSSSGRFINTFEILPPQPLLEMVGDIPECSPYEWERVSIQLQLENCGSTGASQAEIMYCRYVWSAKKPPTTKADDCVATWHNEPALYSFTDLTHSEKHGSMNSGGSWTQLEAPGENQTQSQGSNGCCSGLVMHGISVGQKVLLDIQFVARCQSKEVEVGIRYARKADSGKSVYFRTASFSLPTHVQRSISVLTLSVRPNASDRDFLWVSLDILNHLREACLLHVGRLDHSTRGPFDSDSGDRAVSDWGSYLPENSMRRCSTLVETSVVLETSRSRQIPVESISGSSVSAEADVKKDEMTLDTVLDLLAVDFSLPTSQRKGRVPVGAIAGVLAIEKTMAGQKPLIDIQTRSFPLNIRIQGGDKRRTRLQPITLVVGLGTGGFGSDRPSGRCLLSLIPVRRHQYCSQRRSLDLSAPTVNPASRMSAPPQAIWMGQLTHLLDLGAMSSGKPQGESGLKAPAPEATFEVAFLERGTFGLIGIAMDPEGRIVAESEALEVVCG